MRRLVVLVAASAAISIGSRPAAAQDQRRDDIACRDSASAGLYRRCALSMLDNGSRFLRGAERTVVARGSLFRSAHLARVVVGDSAQFYAMRFDKTNRTARVLVLVGGALIVTSIIKADCSSRNNGCAYDWGMNSPSLKFLVAGTSLGVLGRAIQISAARQGAAAVWWNNERFSR